MDENEKRIERAKRVAADGMFVAKTIERFDQLHKERRILVRIISTMVEQKDLPLRIKLGELDDAKSVGFAFDGDELVLIPSPLEDPDPGPIDRKVLRSYGG